jgi:hypothetical protein
MNDLRQFRDIEKLVEDSVFHPSPRHHLRDRVLRNAIDAQHRQKLWQRFAVISSSMTGMLLIAFLGFRLWTPGPAAAPVTAPVTGPVRVQIYSPNHNLQPAAAPEASPATGTSLGEDLYFHPAHLQVVDPSQAARPAVGSQPTNLSTRKELSRNPE